jgi:hypothetical protein
MKKDTKTVEALRYDNALYGANLYWEAKRAQARAEKKSDELLMFMSSNHVDLVEYMKRTIDEKYCDCEK